MRIFGPTSTGLFVGALLTAASPGHASTTWDLSNNSSSVCTQIVGTGSACIDDTSPNAASGNVFQFKGNDGSLMTAAAFHTANNTGTTALTTTFLGLYNGNGLGAEIASQPGHAVDNMSTLPGGTDFVVFKFSNATYDLLSLVYSRFGSNNDADSTIMFGTPTGALAGITSVQDFAGKTINQIFASSNGGTVNGFKRFDADVTPSTNLVTLNAFPQPNQEIYLIVAASLTNTDGIGDAFKINALTGNKLTVPEPSTLALFLVGAAGVYARRRFAKAPAATA